MIFGVVYKCIQSNWHYPLKISSTKPGNVIFSCQFHLPFSSPLFLLKQRLISFSFSISETYICIYFPLRFANSPSIFTGRNHYERTNSSEGCFNKILREQAPEKILFNSFNRVFFFSELLIFILDQSSLMFSQLITTDSDSAILIFINLNVANRIEV